MAGKSKGGTPSEAVVVVPMRGDGGLDEGAMEKSG